MFPVVLFWVVVSRENRSLPDVLLRTSVVYDWTSKGGRGDEPTSTPRAIVLPQDDSATPPAVGRPLVRVRSDTPADTP